jgi:hypothetical protein
MNVSGRVLSMEADMVAMLEHVMPCSHVDSENDIFSTGEIDEPAVVHDLDVAAALDGDRP